MSNTGGINAKLVNIVVTLVGVCAVAFLLLWAVPHFTQKAGETKDKAVTAVENSQYTLGSAKEWLTQNYQKQDPKITGILTEEVSTDTYEETHQHNADEVMALYNSKNYKAFYFIWIHTNDYRLDFIEPVWVPNGATEWEICEP